MLVKFIRDKYLRFEDAIQIMGEAENLMASGEYAVGSLDVLKLASTSGCSAYDGEFIVLAQELSIPLITMDSFILTTFPGTAMLLDKFISY